MDAKIPLAGNILWARITQFENLLTKRGHQVQTYTHATFPQPYEVVAWPSSLSPALQTGTYVTCTSAYVCNTCMTQTDVYASRYYIYIGRCFWRPIVSARALTRAVELPSAAKYHVEKVRRPTMVCTFASRGNIPAPRVRFISGDRRFFCLSCVAAIFSHYTYTYTR